MASRLVVFSAGRAVGLSALYGFLALTVFAAAQGLTYAGSGATLDLGKPETASWISAVLLFPVILLKNDLFAAHPRFAGWPVAMVRAIFGVLWFHHLVVYLSAGIPGMHSENIWWLLDPWVFLGFLLLDPTALLADDPELNPAPELPPKTTNA